MYQEQTLQGIATILQQRSISLPAAYLTEVLSAFSSLEVTQIMIASVKLNHTSAIWKLQSFTITFFCLFGGGGETHIYKSLSQG